MDLTDVRELNTSRTYRKRVGRGVGSGHGKTSCRGSKGARSRSGRANRPLTEGGAEPLFRRLPKVGFSNFKFTQRYEVVNVGDLEDYFEKGDVVDLAKLREKRLITGVQNLQIKILGDGEISKSFTVKADKFSKSAQAKITAAGGTCEVI